MQARWRNVLSEPLLHFLAIGSVLFALDRALAGPDADADADTSARGTRITGPIVVDAAMERSIRDELVASISREPTPEELSAAVDAWIEGEVLYREGMARGLDRDDPGVHQRVAGHMRSVIAAQTLVPQPTDAELEAWFKEHLETFARPERIDFTHVFVKGDDAAAQQRAEETLALLTGGADPSGLGDTFSGGRRYRARKIPDLAEAFGDVFVVGLAEQAEGTWVLRTSRFGKHLVRVDRRAAAREPSFAEVRDDVEKNWVDTQRDRRVSATIKDYVARWKVERRR